MNRTRTFALAATALTGLSVVGVGATAYAQEATTQPQVEGAREGHKPHGRHAALAEAAASALGMTKEELKTALMGGTTIAQLAQERGVDPATVIAAVTDAANAAIDRAVADGRMTTEQAEQARAAVAEKVADFVNETRPPKAGPAGASHRGGARFGDPLAVAATALGTSKDELKAALTAGTTIAQVAQAKGVDPAVVVTALTDAANAAIDQAVTDGRLNADQATAAKAKAAEHATRIVNNLPPQRGATPKGGR